MSPGLGSVDDRARDGRGWDRWMTTPATGACLGSARGRDEHVVAFGMGTWWFGMGT